MKVISKRTFIYGTLIEGEEYEAERNDQNINCIIIKGKVFRKLYFIFPEDEVIKNILDKL